MDKKTEQVLSQIEAAIGNPEHDADYFVGFRNGLRVAKSLIDGEPVEYESCKPERDENRTGAELIAAAELLKANCKNQKDCHKCIFMSNVCCKFEYKTPEEWELPHCKTRMEDLLEKFPDAKINGSGLPELCAQNLGLVSDCEALVDGNCKACWNAPAESEAE